jgi:hypothetical protein
MMMLISFALGLIPLLGIAWTIATGTIATVDGLFISLILLTLSGIFFLNGFWELRDRGLLGFLDKEKSSAGKETPKPKQG